MSLSAVRTFVLSGAFCGGVCAAAAVSSVAFDPTYDFIASYAGPRHADLDIVAFSAQFESTRNVFIFRGRFAGAIGETRNGVYVIGVNRGRGSALLAAIGVAGALMDGVVIVKNSGVATVATFEPAFKNSPLSGAAEIKGTEFVVTVPAAMLPTTGFAIQDYTATLWSRSDGGRNDLVADLAPDNGSVRVAIGATPAGQGSSR